MLHINPSRQHLIMIIEVLYTYIIDIFSSKSIIILSELIKKFKFHFSVIKTCNKQILNSDFMIYNIVKIKIEFYIWDFCYCSKYLGLLKLLFFFFRNLMIKFAFWGLIELRERDAFGWVFNLTIDYYGSVWDWVLKWWIMWFW